MKTINFAQLKEMAVNRVDRIRREALSHWREMTAAEAPAGEMATAFAAGTLVSTIPLPLLDMAIAAFIMRRYDRLPRAPFFTAMALTNNLVMAPLYASTPKVGGFAIHWMAVHTPVVAPEAFVVRVLVGYVLIALGMALGSFVLANTGFRGLKLARRSA